MTQPITNDTNFLKELLETYYPLHFFALFRAHELRNVSPYLDKLEEPILDLGCGDGRVAKLLFNKQLAYGIDPDAKAVKHADKINQYEKTFVKSAYDIPIESDHLGGIYSNCVLEHIDDMERLIHEIARVLKSGAYFVGTAMTPHYYDLNPVFDRLKAMGWNRLRKRMIDSENRAHHHVSIYDKDDYTTMFENAGMRLETQSYFAPKPVVNFYAWWDTLGKYWFPLQPKINHKGFLMAYLKIRYSLVNKAKQVERWERQLRPLYEIDANENKVGAAQILVARKL